MAFLLFTPADRETLVLACHEIGTLPAHPVMHECVQAVQEAVADPSPDLIEYAVRASYEARRYCAVRSNADFWDTSPVGDPFHVVDTMIDAHASAAASLTAMIAILQPYCAGLTGAAHLHAAHVSV